MEEAKEIGLAEGREKGLLEGRAEGRELKLQELIEKKLKKGKSFEIIADELEEDIDTIASIVEKMKLL